MPPTDKPIRPSEHDDGVARAVYFHKRIPRDQYKKRPEDLQELADTINRLTGREDKPDQWLRYIQNQQKATTRYLLQGREPWPTFDGEHQKAPALTSILSAEQMESLRESYEIAVLPYELGTDAAVWHESVVAALAAEFTRRTGAIVPGILLLAIVEEKRKRGLWFKVGRKRQVNLAFGDLDALDDAEGSDRE
jgi:hypothetical protein